MMMMMNTNDIRTTDDETTTLSRSVRNQILDDAISYPRTVLFKHLSRVPLSQQVMYMYHCQSTKHVRVPLSTGNVSAYFQDIDLPGSFNVETSNFAVATFLIECH
jgi:hypothetical protein